MRRFFIFAAGYCCFRGLLLATQTPDIPGILAFEKSKFSHFPAIEFTATSYTEQAGDFRRLNPQLALTDQLTTVYRGVIESNRFQITATSHHKDGKELPSFVSAWDGEHYSSLDPMGRPLLVVANRPMDSTLMMPLGTVVLLPFEFLFPTANMTGTHFISPTGIEKAIDDDLASINSGSISLQSATDPDVIRFKINQPDKSYYIVSVSKSLSFFPTKYEKYGPDGQIIQRYTVSNFASLGVPGEKALLLPRTVTLDLFLDGWPRSTTKITLDSVKLASNVDDGIFQIDPALADAIWDADRGVQIRVPR